MNPSRALVCLVLALVNTDTAFAIIRPSFYLDDCAWHATHIVVVTKGKKIDENVEVVESWKGDLKKGDPIAVPELAVFALEKERVISPLMFGRNEKIATHVSCSRMLLFLVKKQDKVGAAEKLKVTWLPANSWWKQMNVSMAWIEKGQVYAFAQQFNPGPSQLIPWQMNECALLCRVDEITSARTALTKALTIGDPDVLAAATFPMVKAGPEFVRRQAVLELGSAGPNSLPTLRKILQEDSLVDQHWRAIRSMAKAGGVKVGPELTGLLDQELTFWQKTGPKLKKGWWNGSGLEWKEVDPLRERYSKTLAVIEGLETIRFAGCEKSVRAFGRYWRSQPQLNEIAQMGEACDKLLAKLQ
jgi:hypothetical protein